MPSDSIVYEVVGAVDRAAAETLGTTGDTILVDDGDDEYLIAAPKGGSDE